MMKIDGYLLVVVFLCVATHGCTHLQKNEDIVFQASTISALLEGVYDGNVTYKDLKKRGDFGIGTFNSLDGEMIGLEGKFYQIKKKRDVHKKKKAISASNRSRKRPTNIRV